MHSITLIITFEKRISRNFIERKKILQFNRFDDGKLCILVILSKFAFHLKQFRNKPNSGDDDLISDMQRKIENDIETKFEIFKEKNIRMRENYIVSILRDV